MHSNSTDNNAVFFSGIHMDLLGRLAAPAHPGTSNPGKITTMAGGASLNSASVASLLGLKCTIIGMVGDDQAGAILADTLKHRAITNRLTICQGKNTGSYTSIIEPDGNLHIAIADLGLNEEMRTEWILENFHREISGADIWFVNSNLSADTLLNLTDKHLPQRPKILAAASISPSKSQKLAPSLANIDVLFTNITEASAMLNVITGKKYDAPQFSAASCIGQIRKLGVTRGSLSQGADFLWVWDKSGVYKFKPPSLDKIVDVTGAGDALAGTFLTGLANNMSIVEISPLAIAAAQMTITTLGPYNPDINIDELKSLAVHVKAPDIQ
ncbi:MAG: hypothetical protein GY742_08290 [Hyphomicrobiales bacterium]|nr:hypothetical protein [Hyphomicrobiales bacterium]